MDAPSSLPSFVNLARELAEAARVDFNDSVDIDRFLGSMPSDFDTHAHAHGIISRGTSTPNATHKALVRLASSSGAARLVTTNFDDHLSTAAISEGVAFADRWSGPALPVGDDFTGVVHLHGSVTRAPRELVLTDRDFGRAYLNDAWATRFLQKMFERYTVLFVGYSLDDPIMRYLSLGLPSKTRRYVLTHKPDDEKWSHLGIRPITYPGTDTNHATLLAALEAWDVRARMGQLDHSARMETIVRGGPGMTPVDHDYVRRQLRTVEGARDFAAVADSVAWLRWMEDLAEFKALFNGGEVTTASRVLAHWFGETFVKSPELHGAALQSVQRLGSRFAPELVSATVWAATRLSEADERAGRRWKTILATSIKGYSAPPDLDFLLPYQPSDRVEPLAVLRAAVRPQLVLGRRWFLQDEDGDTPPDAGVKWHADEASLTAHLQLAIQEASVGDEALAGLLEDALVDAYNLLDGYHGPRTFDPLGFSRSAIEQHEQDSHRNPQDALVDALRDLGLKRLSTVPDLPERWWRRNLALFRRLALHLLASDASRTPDQQLLWLLDRQALYMSGEKHETYGVLAVALPTASASIRAQVLAAALRGPDYPEDTPERDRRRAYATFNLLAWLKKSAPDWSEAETEFERLQSTNSTFEVREHPDLGHWSSGGTWGGRLPIDPEDFIREANDDPHAALEGLVARDYSERNFDEPTWDDALSVIRRVAETEPSSGLRTWQAIEERADLGERAADLKRAILGGWERCDLGIELDSVLALVAPLVSDEDSARAISQFLLGQIRQHVDRDESPATAAMRVIARDLWSAHKGSFEHGPDSDAAFLALNSWPGELATFWAVEVDRRWRHHRDDWDGLNLEEGAAILELLGGPPATLDATRPAFASLAYFLFAADPEFFGANLIPMFSQDATAPQVWGSFLYNPRVSDQMLAAGLLDGIVAEWNWLDNLGDRGLKHQFFSLAASVVTYAGIAQRDRQRLLDTSVLASHGELAESFASAVLDLLDSTKVAGEEVWDLWLADHVTARVAGLPRNAAPEELARWADTVPFLGDRLVNGIEAFRDKGIGLGANYSAPSFPDGVLATHGPALVEHLADRVRHSIPTGWQLPYAVGQLIEGVRAIMGDGVQPIVDAARESGFHPNGS